MLHISLAYHLFMFTLTLIVSYKLFEGRFRHLIILN